jgi:glutaconate CoA-transferase subunit B
MRIESIHPGTSLDDVLANLGFQPIVPAELSTTPPPTAEQVWLIRNEIDPEGMYGG